MRGGRRGLCRGDRDGLVGFGAGSTVTHRGHDRNPVPKAEALSDRAAVTDGRQAGPALELADFKRAFKRFQRDQITDDAAALTYYSLLSLFPALLFGAALLGVFGQQALIEQAAAYLRDAGAPPETVDAVTGALASAQDQRGTAVAALVMALVTGLYGASGAFGGAGRALNRIFRVEEGRGFVKRKGLDLLWTLVVMLLALVTLVLVFLGGGLASDVLGKIGLGETVPTVWLYVRWPAALLVMMTLYAIVYYAAPNVEVRRFRWITPGSVVGVLLWIVASFGFFVYVANFSSYSATYGAFAGAVILLVWLWVTNLALLFGAELNAVVDLRRAKYLPESYDGPVLPAKEPAEA
ncbi:MAG TPA: YihY/virulence factor BrkB family protein [Solirubrobacter sp.]|nr:YihY/virulence factor BrkB family protein [Solirubrobacter sp.]